MGILSTSDSLLEIDSYESLPREPKEYSSRSFKKYLVITSVASLSFCNSVS